MFLHLERDEETELTMDNLSKKMVRNRALSRSLSLQSKSTSYQSLQNETGVISNNIDNLNKQGNEIQENNVLHVNENAPLTGVQGLGGEFGNWKISSELSFELISVPVSFLFSHPFFSRV